MQTTKKLSQERHKETSQLERGLVSARDELLSTRRQVMWTQKDTKTNEMAHLIIKPTLLGQGDDLEMAKESQRAQQAGGAEERRHCGAEQGEGGHGAGDERQDR